MQAQTLATCERSVRRPCAQGQPSALLHGFLLRTWCGILYRWCHCHLLIPKSLSMKDFFTQGAFLYHSSQRNAKDFF